jgi:DNA-binding beta-propeller fold protein YncE
VPLRPPFGGREAGTATRRTIAVLALGAALGCPGAARGAASSECLVAWRVADAAPANGRLVCRDGDPRCDADGVADGGCTFATGLCVNDPGCTPGTFAGVTLAGAAAPPVAGALAATPFPVAGAALCTATAPVRVSLGRTGRRQTVLSAEVRDETTGRGPSRALVVTTDFETGLLATVGVASPHRVERPATPIHSDAVVRVTGGRAFVVNRFLGDNLQVLDPTRGFATRLQCSTGSGSNPHDVVLAGAGKAYVSRYNARDLWVVDPDAPSCAGFLRGTIDLSPWADADGLPEMDQMALVGGRLFVSLERLDRARRFAPAGRSRLAVVDTATDTVPGVVELTGENAFSETSGIAREPGTGKLLVAEAGNIFTTGDGGIERVDPDTLVAEGFFVTEDALGGSITDFVVASPTRGYAVVFVAENPPKNVLVAFDPSRGTLEGRLLVRTGNLPDVALAPDGTLWVADQTLPAPGLRLLDPDTGRQLTRGVVDVGLPPFSIAFLP